MMAVRVNNTMSIFGEGQSNCRAREIRLGFSAALAGGKSARG
jgi:hypothetical protein